MTYIRPHKNPYAQIGRIVGTAVAVLVLLILIVEWRAPSAFPGLAAAVSRPFWRMQFAVESGALASPQALLAENESLELQLSALEAETASSSVQALIDENAGLRSLLGRASTTPLLGAAVLERPPLLPYDELILDVGTDDGAGSTSLVYAPGRIAIGRIEDAYPQTSKAILFSSPGQTYPVSIGRAHVPANAVGRGGGQYQAQAPHDSGIQPGDIVSDMSFSDGTFGVVVSVSTDPADPFDEILFAPPVNVYQLRWVLVGEAPALVSTKAKR